MFTPSWSTAIAKIGGRQPIIDPRPHCKWHLMRIHDQVPFWLKTQRQRVKGYDEIPGNDEQHKLLPLLNAQQDCIRKHTDFIDLLMLGQNV
jgi:hypothetical protein